jgi:hypothetical protein
MDKAIGFRRNIYLEWMDAPAATYAAGDGAAALRAHLDPIVAHKVASAENRGYALTILANIWLYGGERYPQLHAAALNLYAAAAVPDDRRWLHYGMAMAAYPFFQQTVRAIGRQVLRKDTFALSEIKSAMIADRGHPGGVAMAAERVVFSLRDWGLLSAGGRKGVLAPPAPRLATADLGLQAWLLALALNVHSGEELPYLDLIRLPELYPFGFTVTLDDLRRHPWVGVQRQGVGLDMVRLVG